jgi:ATP-dependent Clp protease ATP-binding subunit ClpA
MFERFTDRARKVVALANQEAIRFNHQFIGTEHVLLGMVKEGSGTGANVLRDLNIDLRKVRLEVEKLIKSGPEMVKPGKLPQTPRFKKAIEYAIEEARFLGHHHVGTEHLLLGLIRERDGVAAQVLRNFGVNLDELRKRILESGLNSERVEMADPDPSVPQHALTQTAVNALRSSFVSFRSPSGVPISTGHILIGLLREKDSVAGKVLAKIGLTEEIVKQELAGGEN